MPGAPPAFSQKNNLLLLDLLGLRFLFLVLLDVVGVAAASGFVLVVLLMLLAAAEGVVVVVLTRGCWFLFILLTQDSSHQKDVDKKAPTHNFPDVHRMMQVDKARLCDNEFDKEMQPSQSTWFVKTQ